MSKSGASAPPSIDPMALANAQSQANQQSAQFQSQLNNVNTTSPFGSSLFTQDPTTHQWSLNQSLAPQLQSVFGAQSGLAGLLAGLAPSAAGAASNFTGYASPAANAGSNFINQASGVNLPTPGAGLTSSVTMNPAGFNLPPSIDFSNLPGLATHASTEGLARLPTSATDFSNEVNAAENAAYRSQAQYLDPQFHQRESDLTQQLADQGIQPGNAAYSRSRGDLGRQENLAYQGAQDAATAAGQAEQARLFGENLSSRQQGFGENLSNAGLNNAARAQLLGQDVTGTEYARSADQQVFNQGLANAELGNQAQQLAFGQPLQELQSLIGAGSGLLGAGGGALTSGIGGLAGLGGLGEFGWGGQIPTFGSQGTVVPGTNTIGAANAANTAGMNSFLAGNQLNNQLFNGLGSLGGALGLGNGGLASLLGIGGSGAAAAGGGAGLDAAAAALPLMWIVCTELMRQGRMPKRHWITGAPVFAAYPETVKNGYYLWAIPTVRHLRRHPDSLFSKAVGTAFRWRAENIAAHKGVPGARKLWRGAMVTAALYPVCKMLGHLVGKQDWASVYREGVV
jgi:hypothetical protein